MNGEALASAAVAMVGTRFVLHGRDPRTGLDCVGLLAAALCAIGLTSDLPATYALRTRTQTPANLASIARACGLEPTCAPLQVGHVALVRSAACQLHLLIALSSDRFVHAHAGLRRVALLDGTLPWPLVQAWRLADTD